MRAPTVRLRRLAGELRQLRKAANLTREEVSERTGVNVATLYRIETARVRPQSRTLAGLLDAYTVSDPKRSELVTLLKESAHRGWLHTFASELPEHYASYIEFEAEASEVLNYECLFIPGLLQTERYARAAISGALPESTREEIESRVDVRMQRQAALTKARPLKLWAIVDEAAIRRVVGGREVMREQLDHLLRITELPTVHLQVIPFDAGAHPGMPGSFVVMNFPEAIGPDIVYIDSQAGDLFLEEEADIARYSLVFTHLRAVALSPSASASLIAAVAKETASGQRSMMTTPHDLSRAQWRRSRRSSGNGQCVEVASVQPVIAVRDSKAPDSGHLTLSPQGWAAFIAQARAGRYDRGAG